MKYLSVCSGIEAATVAWHPLGWEPAAFSEIEPFPCALLAKRFPGVPNLGDMTKYYEWPAELRFSLLVGGTPCQGFSLAGLRGGLDDPRSQLMLTYVEIAAKYRPDWLVWENVPGVLSSADGADFAAFLGALTGRAIRVPENGWGNSGVIEGIPEAYGVAWRVLDAQFCGVPQRRRRVFVVGYIGDWRRAAAVLFERESLSGDSAPRREAGKVVAALTSCGVGTCGADDNQAQAGYLINCPEVAGALEAQYGQRNNPAHETWITTSPADSCVGTLLSNGKAAGSATNQDAENGFLLTVAHTLRGEGYDASEDGTGRGTPLVPVAYRTSGNCGAWETGDKTDALTTGTDPNSHGVRLGMAVRRLTPMECERLQGFPDGHTALGLRGKPTPDGPRYKALGNSMAVPCMSWIGRRIAAATAAAP